MELDLEHYVVPSPVSYATSGTVYPANLTENPRSINYTNSDSTSFNSSVTNQASGVMQIERAATQRVLSNYCFPDSVQILFVIGMVNILLVLRDLAAFIKLIQ